MILKWLDTGKASWSSLVEALKSPLVNKMGLAEQIIKDHPKKCCVLYDYTNIHNYAYTLKEIVLFSDFKIMHKCVILKSENIQPVLSLQKKLIVCLITSLGCMMYYIYTMSCLLKTAYVKCYSRSQTALCMLLTLVLM